MADQKKKMPIQQSGVIPYRLTDTGIEIMLITAKSFNQGWIVPKGKLEPDMTPACSAAKEAYEEAGILGDVSHASIGSYCYIKSRNKLSHQVHLYPLEITKILPEANWLERKLRQRQLVDSEEALSMICLPQLTEVVQTFVLKALSETAASAG